MLRPYLLAALISLSLWSCKNEDKDIIPKIHFKVVLNLDDPRYSGQQFEVFQVPGQGFAGLKGVAVYRFDTFRYLAFDMVCPNEGDKLVKVVRDKNAETYTCPQCKSKYHINIEYGLVEGVSKWPLKMYSTYYDETTNHLIISN